MNRDNCLIFIVSGVPRRLSEQERGEEQWPRLRVRLCACLIVHVWFWPHVGGGNQHVEMLGRELVKLGHEVTVWCADVPEHEEKQFQRGGINVVRLSPSRVFAGVDPVVSLEGLSMDEFDIVHLHDTLPILIRKSLKMARNAGVPVVTTYHNDYIKNGFIANSIKSIRWSMQGKKTLHSSDARIVLTQH